MSGVGGRRARVRPRFSSGGGLRGYKIPSVDSEVSGPSATTNLGDGECIRLRCGGVVAGTKLPRLLSLFVLGPCHVLRVATRREAATSEQEVR